MYFKLTQDEIDTVLSVFNGLLKDKNSSELNTFLDDKTIRDMAILFGRLSYAKYCINANNYEDAIVKNFMDVEI